MQRLLERIEHEARMRRAADAPADDPPGEGVDHECDVDETGPVATWVKSDTHSALGRSARTAG